MHNILVFQVLQYYFGLPEMSYFSYYTTPAAICNMIFPGQTFINDNTKEYCTSNLFNIFTINVNFKALFWFFI
jgi:hypothetical protein